MVRGTYFPWPVGLNVSDKIPDCTGAAAGRDVSHTGLGEEGAEALVGFSGFALLSQEAIGLQENNASALASIVGRKGAIYT